MSRDLRDPKALGEALLGERLLNGKAAKTLSELADHVARYYDKDVPDYGGSNDIVTVTQAGAEH